MARTTPPKPQPQAVTPKALFRRSELTDAIVRYLRELPKESTITYGEISRHVGEQLKAQASQVLSARRILQNEDRQVWWPIRPGVGLRRLNDQEMAALIGKFYIPGARGKLRRGGDVADRVTFEALDTEERTRAAAHVIQMNGALTTLSRVTHNKIIASRGSSNDLPSFNAVEWAISLSPRRHS